MAPVDIGQQLGQQIAAARRCVPEMMVRIDDRQFRLKRGFFRPARQPCLQLSVIAVGQPAVFALGILCHVPPLPKTRPYLGYFIVPAQAEIQREAQQRSNRWTVACSGVTG